MAVAAAQGRKHSRNQQGRGIMVDQRIYEKGEFVEIVDLSQFGPFEVPMPKRWYALRTHSKRETRVMRTFRQRNISAYFPEVIESKTVTRVRHGYSLDIKRNVTSPLFAGIIFIPDFQKTLGGVLDVEGVDNYFMMGDCIPYLTPRLMADVRILAALGNIPASRKKRLWKMGELVRVTDGPFRSSNGLVDRLDSTGRLKILVEILGRLSPVELSEDHIEAV
jgi:transcription termination/antitermination protein NusG